ncbi:hypothetical protein SynBOUM118_00716 [Synechococcus sp. BOUM118]|nr:hypothetical protein SynBOUM118_00716 [Synechococcus sp. BOUM118]
MLLSHQPSTRSTVKGACMPSERECVEVMGVSIHLPHLLQNLVL